jgi:PadR family transcriptional regulator PadR
VKLLSRNEEYLLLAVQRLEDDAYSSSIRDLLKNETGKSWSYGSIFVSLESLEQKGYLSSRMSSSKPVQGGRSKRIYTVAPAGEIALQEALKAHTSMWANVSAQLGGAHS